MSVPGPIANLLMVYSESRIQTTFSINRNGTACASRYQEICFRTWRGLLACALAASLSSMLGAQRREERVIDPQRPLQVDLLGSLDAGKLNPGSPVFAKSRVEWSISTCHLRAGAAVSGHVVDLARHSKDRKGSSLTVLFDMAECDGHATPLAFNLFAVIAAVQVQQSIPLADYGAFGAAATGPHFGGGGGAGPHAAIPFDRNQDIALTEAGRPIQLPAVIQSGQVFGQKSLFLAVGIGRDGGSTLSTPKGNLRVESGAQFVLMPKPVLSPQPVAAAASASLLPIATIPSSSEQVTRILAPPPPPKPEIDETEICSASCSVISSGASPDVKAASTISAKDLGYIPHENGEYSSLNHEASVHFLGADDLLFTFDLHRLRHRYPDGIRTESMRVVRAVLIDAGSHKVQRVSDWQVQGSGQYVWPIGQGKLLVHKGHALYLLDAHLDALRSVSVPGQLVFLSASPDGKRIVVGSLHERHNRDLHNQLIAALHVEPEEDIDVQLYDENFRLLLTSYQSTSMPPPVLSDSGEIRMRSVGHDRWRISEYSWDRADRVLATLHSTCRLHISAPFAGSVFVVGCNTSPVQNWYRMLRFDGRPLLVNKGSSREIEQAVSAGNDGRFAIRVVATEHTKANGDFFHKNDLRAQEISVYREADGKRIFATTADPSLADQSYALSPSGRQLAVLADGQLSFYTMPLSRGQAEISARK